MPRLTEMQQLAVDKENCNIIVSAGAGSGKTTVLKTRVERKLMEGTNINDLIILTFTNFAAAEMKDRIRTVIKNNPSIAYMEEYIDSSYITTFDSFAQSMVKKYAHLLNMTDSFSIFDANIIDLECDKIIDEIFEEYYKEENPLFLKLISEQTVKNDSIIRSSIKNIYRKLQNMIDKKTYLDNYITSFYSPDFIEKTFSILEEYVCTLKDDILDLIEVLNDYSSSESVLKNETNIADFRESSSYDEILLNYNFTLVRNVNENYSEEAGEILKKISDIKKTISNLKNNGDKKMLINNYLLTKDYALIIIDILRELDKRLNKFKEEHNSYEFMDIALKAIELVKEHASVREEIKYKTKEIMIDEYQDTNDIQEEFISYISNNNVYMVGDIKQSIYRFRNANPYIFKTKYDHYRDGLNGFKIDLMENFRSRNNVIDIINTIFKVIMTDDVGGCNYKSEHMMIYGNKNYDEFKENDYDLEIINYPSESNYSQVEKEAFIIVDDIKKRINNKEKVTYYDNDMMKIRDVTFKDFVILVDKSKQFEKLKKILEANNIPVAIKRDINIKDDDEIYILKSIITLIIKIRKKCYDTSFKHAYLSVARSYLFNLDDEEIFKTMMDKTFEKTDIYRICKDISLKIDALSNRDILTLIIDQFAFYDKLLTVNNINDRLLKLEYIVNNSINLNKFGMNIYSLCDYLENIINSDNEIKMKSEVGNENAVKIMTIHSSKGLEFPYVYLPLLTTDFYRNNSSDLFKLSKYGFTLPFYNDGVGTTFIHNVDKISERIEILSEKIRLYYVAITRAKEKLIMINPYVELDYKLNEKNIAKVNRFSDIINGLNDQLSQYHKYVDIDTLNVNKQYNETKENNYKSKITLTNEVISVKELSLDNKVLDNKHFSKTLSTIIDKNLKEKLDFGTFMHYVYEVSDFKNIDQLDISDVEKQHVINFLNHEEVKNIDQAKIYKELEIRFNDGNNTFHGFIDLLLEYDDHFDIIDYKLSNIDSDEYQVQLSGYKKYIEKNYCKKTNIYLYSINKDLFKKLD